MNSILGGFFVYRAAILDRFYELLIIAVFLLGRSFVGILQREPLQHRKRTDNRGVVSRQAGTSRFEDLILNRAAAL